MFRLFQL
jgi:hypothetical protein